MNSGSVNNRPPAPIHRPRENEVPLRIPSRTLSSEALFDGSREIGIEHHGALYRLKITRQGKLILNK